MISILGETVSPTIFPDKTSQVWHLSQDLIDKIKQKYSNIDIYWEFENEAELIHVLQLALLCRHINIGKIHACKIALLCPYLPYGRQDKDIQNSSCFGLSLFCELLEVYIDRLWTFDAHNPSFFQNDYGLSKYAFEYSNTLPQKEIEDIAVKDSSTLFLYPDAGAEQRYSSLFTRKSIYCDKVRDEATGRIVDISLPEISTGEDILVIDDLCDGGRTFIELAKKVKPYNPRSLNLYVSHGIFSAGVKCLYDAGYDKVYTRKGLVVQ